MPAQQPAGLPAATVPAQQPVTITSSQPNSTLANKVDFDSLDGNRDGMLSRREAAPNTELTNSFAAIDADHNGQISKRELAGGK